MSQLFLQWPSFSTGSMLSDYVQRLLYKFSVLYNSSIVNLYITDYFQVAYAREVHQRNF